MSIHQEIRFNATPATIYRALIDSDQHAAFTGAPAKVSEDVGGACTWHDGQVTGRNIELVPDSRIVQAWRFTGWDEGIYSIVRYQLVADGDETRVILDQAGHPAAMTEHLESGWHERYWKPLRKYLED